MTKRSIAHESGLAGRRTTSDVFGNFPSYSRVFGNFFSRYAAKLHWKTDRCLGVCRVRFFIVRASVAFV